MENEKPDNERNKPKRGVTCEICSQFFSIEESVEGNALLAAFQASFTPFICDPCYQELDF